MGILDGFRKRRDSARHQRATEAFGRLHASWTEEAARVDEMLDVVRECLAGRLDTYFGGKDDYGFIVAADETPLCYLEGAAYLENVRAPSRTKAGYGGVSFPLFGGVRLNTGRISGNTVPGREQTTMTDEGNALITDKRVIFVGTRRNQEWSFARMLGMSHMPEGYTVFAVRNRTKPTGIGYGSSVGTDVQFRLELASALATGTLARFESELLAEKAQIDAARPLPPPPPSTP
jgi:hypothetical protein